jgi:hypothetical protein
MTLELKAGIGRAAICDAGSESHLRGIDSTYVVIAAVAVAVEIVDVAVAGTRLLPE